MYTEKNTFAICIVQMEVKYHVLSVKNPRSIDQNYALIYCSKASHRDFLQF